MAEQSFQDKTEDASPKKIKKAREEGNVSKSMELNSAAILLVGTMALFFMSGEIFGSMRQFMAEIYGRSSSIGIDPGTILVLAPLWMNFIMGKIIPLLLLLMITGIGINMAQVGVNFASKAMTPKFSKISPVKGLKKLFSTRSLVNALKGFIKIGIVSAIGYSVLTDHLDEYWLLASNTVGQSMVFLGEMLFELAMKIGFAMLILAIPDYAFQRYKHNEDLKMTKQEVKDENKQTEGNPELKGKIRAKQLETSRKRMMAAVPDATVVLTNPTFIAIALQYNFEDPLGAPKVVAKGKRKIAERIKAIAKENNVPIVENKMLARSMYDYVEIGMDIPMVFYQTVAEILAQVYHLNKNSKIGAGTFAR